MDEVCAAYVGVDVVVRKVRSAIFFLLDSSD